MLTWSTPDDHRGVICAAGGKGRYHIRWKNGYLLTGVGHDDLPMLVIHHNGRLFETLDKAKDFAEAIERVKTVESQISGA